VPGLLQAESYPLKAAIKDAAGRAALAFRENVEQITAPEPQSGAKLRAVAGYPVLAAFDSFSNKEEGRGGLPYCLEYGLFFVVLKVADIAAHNPQAWKRLAYVFFRPL